MPVTLADSLDAWGSENYPAVLLRELLALPSGTLPLHLATEQGGMVDDSNLKISILGSDEAEHALESRAWVFFEEVIGGCNCYDDPARSRLLCTLLVLINKRDATASFSLLDE